MQIAWRIVEPAFERSRRRLYRLFRERMTVDGALRLLHALRSGARADHADVGIRRGAVRIEVVIERDAGKREVAAAAREFLERPAPVRRPARQTQLDDQLVVAQGRRQRTGEEFA